MEKDILFLKSGDYILMMRDDNKKIFGDYFLPETITEEIKGSTIKEREEKRLENLLKSVKEQTGISIIKPKLKGRVFFKDYSEKESVHAHIYTAKDYTGKFKKEEKIYPVWLNEDGSEISKKPEYKLISEWMKQEGSFVGYIVSNGNGVIEKDSFAEFINFQAI
jgi:hypothetical protein